MADISTPGIAVGGHSLHVDDHALTIGSVSVGLPRARTSDDVYRRYLDLLDLLQRRAVFVLDPPAADVQALADATAMDAAYVARRLVALQSEARPLSRPRAATT